MGAPPPMLFLSCDWHFIPLQLLPLTSSHNIRSTSWMLFYSSLLFYSLVPLLPLTFSLRCNELTFQRLAPLYPWPSKISFLLVKLSPVCQSPSLTLDSLSYSYTWTPVLYLQFPTSHVSIPYFFATLYPRQLKWSHDNRCCLGLTQVLLTSESPHLPGARYVS